MPNVLFKDVTLAFTNCMERESDFGGFNFSFIINKDSFCKTVREVLTTQKVKCWDDSKNTDNFIIKKTNAKSKDDVTFDPVKEMMTDDDLLIQVKSKNAPIENTKGVRLGRGTTADILIDVFEYSYGKRDFICVRAHADRGITVKVNNLNEFKGATSYFEKENTAEEGFNKVALDLYASGNEDLALY
jgi:hypothetical protein